MSTGTETEKKLRILELFAGIGGLHWALKVTNVPHEIIAAMEINPTVMQIYSHNFPETPLINRNIQGITAKEINDLEVDAVVMSPPCQPFCRMGNRLDTEDNRTGPLSHLTEVLGDVNFKYIFVENVQGFEESIAREKLLETLLTLNFVWQEFMLTPKSVNVPNSRLRYYLIGKKNDLSWCFTLNTNNFLSKIPNWCNNSNQMPFANLKQQYEKEIFLRRKRWKEVCPEVEDLQTLPFCVGDIVDWCLPDQVLEQLKLTNHKYQQAMDIVTPLSSSTCCFTKGYGHFVKGTGSILSYSMASEKSNLNNSDSNSATLEKLRYFSPREICRLMSYPEEFQIPENLSLKQTYRALGNSVNVYVVAILFSLLFSE